MMASLCEDEAERWALLLHRGCQHLVLCAIFSLKKAWLMVFGAFGDMRHVASSIICSAR